MPGVLVALELYFMSVEFAPFSIINSWIDWCSLVASLESFRIMNGTCFWCLFCCDHSYDLVTERS